MTKLGKRAGLRGQWEQSHGGSSPLLGTRIEMQDVFFLSGLPSEARRAPLLLALHRLMYHTAEARSFSLPRKREKLERAIRTLQLDVLRPDVVQLSTEKVD